MNENLIAAYVYSHLHGGYDKFAKRIHAMLLSAMTAEEIDKAKEIIRNS